MVGVLDLCLVSLIPDKLLSSTFLTMLRHSINDLSFVVKPIESVLGGIDGFYSKVVSHVMRSSAF